jgi:hypothetical protein
MTMKKQNMTARLAAFSTAIVLFALAGSGCIFDTRDAKPPEPGVDQIALDDAIDVFASMRVGLEEDAVSNYERAIGDAFVFSPLLDDSLDQNFTGPPNAFANWTRQIERDVTSLLLSDAKTIDVEFNASEEISENTYVRFRTNYELSVVLVGDTATTTYKGVAFIDVRRMGGIWQVEYWDEIEPVGNFTTWGFLRGTLRQRVQ